jgi:SAM-dependent methyltransferase
MQDREKKALESNAWRLVTQRAVLPWVLRFADLPERADVLEVGCGAGFNAETFCDRYPGWRYTATDVDPEMVSLARERIRRFGRFVTTETADATKLPYADDVFDLAISIGVWHQVGEWERALRECARVLRPGGLMLLVDLLPGFFKGPLAKLFPPARTYTISDIRAELGNAGFARFRVRVAGSLWYRLVAETAAPTAVSSAGT